MDIKYELKNKQSNDKIAVRIMPDDTDAMSFLMLGMMEMKNCNIENAVKFLTQVDLAL